MGEVVGYLHESFGTEFRVRYVLGQEEHLSWKDVARSVNVNRNGWKP